MKGQWGLIFALVFALIVAIFAVINVETVSVDYLFGTAQWPLVLIILVSALVGGLAVGGFGIFRIFRLRREIRTLKETNHRLNSELEKSSKEELAKKTETEGEKEQAMGSGNNKQETDTKR